MRNDFKVMVAIQSEAPGSRPLPNASNEIHNIQTIVPKENLITLGLENVPASSENVLKHLREASIAHFACHGKQEMDNPLESFLLLHDGEMLKISKLMENPMPNASLVYLSACETAKGSGSLPDEAMHIAASMLFAGFYGAVATMW